MKIESIIKRKKGTTVKMDNPTATYKFLPESGNFEDPHVAVVDDEGHARLFLKHDEAYRLHEGKAPAPLPEEEEVQPLGSSLVTGENYTIEGGDTVELQVLVNMAFDDSELEVEAWNELADEDRGARIKAVLAELKGSNPDAGEGANNPPAAGENTGEGSDNPEPNKEPGTAPAKAEDGALNPDDYTRNQLIEMFQKRFGRKPSTQMDKEAIARALSQDDE